MPVKVCLLRGILHGDHVEELEGVDRRVGKVFDQSEQLGSGSLAGLLGQQSLESFMQSHGNPGQKVLKK